MSNFSRGGQHEVARIVVNDSGARIAHHVMVLFGEVLGRCRRNTRLDFADRDVLDFGMNDERSGRDTGAASNHQNRFRIRMQQRRQMSEQPLQPHVLRFGRRFHLAAHVKVRGHVVVLRIGDGGIHAFGDVEQSPVAGGGGAGGGRNR